MTDNSKFEAERLIYAFIGMSLSEYAEKILKEYNTEMNSQIGSNQDIN